MTTMYEAIISIAGTPQTVYGEFIAYLVALILTARLILAFVDLFYLIGSFGKSGERR